MERPTQAHHDGTQSLRSFQKNGSKPSSKVALFFICAEQRGHGPKQNRAPKQVLEVVTLHAVCEE